MHDIDTALLRTFVYLAETCSFSRTGERVGRSQSAVSAQIAKLEERLGCTLFDRNKRNVRLTADGEKLLGYAYQMIDLADAMIDRFRHSEVTGEVRFGSPEDFATTYLPDVLAAFSEGFPEVHLNVSCDLTLRLIAGFEAGDYDLIIIKQDPADIYPDAHRLWRERLVWVGGKRLMELRDFARAPKPGTAHPLPLVLSPSPCVYRHRATHALDDAGVPWKIAYTSPSFAGTAAAVKAGLGLSVLPRTMVPDDLIVFEDKAGWPMLSDAEICLLAAPRPSAATQALAGFIEERVGTYRRGE
ncbi:MAG: LysR family transcriptional regulator [Rhodothalassiaceae bacterium]